MKILVFSDLQCHAYAQFASRDAAGLNTRFRDCLNIIKQATELVKSEHCVACIFPGDLFESRTKIDVDVFTETWKAMKTLAEECQLIMLCGNHDQHVRVGDIHSLEPFKPFAAVIDKPTRIEVSGVSIAGYPFTPDSDALKKWLLDLPHTDILVLHQTIAESLTHIPDKHVNAELAQRDIPLERLNLVLCGHIHSRQTFARGKIHLPGSPLQLTFGERGEEKAFTIIDTSDWTLTSVPTDAPRFYQLEFGKDSADPIGEDWDAHGIRMDRDFLRLRFDGKWTDSVNTLKTRFPRIQIEQLDDEEVVVTYSQEVIEDDCSLLREYISRNNPESIDEQALLETGLELLLGETV